MKVLVVAGTRPEVIKLFPVIEALRPKADTILCTTGQHRELLTQALAAFDLVPDIALDVMEPGQSLNRLAARLIEQMDEAIEASDPDWVLVQGDTISAFCAAYSTFQRGIRIGHVEAGLRTYDLGSPFPEEANRQLLSRIASRHFAPTRGARRALIEERVAAEAVILTGNTVVDAVRHWQARAGKVAREKLILVTCHRRENLGDRLEGICTALVTLARTYPDHQLVFPLHHNPAVRQPVQERLKGLANVALVEPLGYEEMLLTLSRARLIVTDSGGIQEEAPSLGTPIVIMRNHTERQEGVEAGFSTLAGVDPEAIVRAARSWLDNPDRIAALGQKPNPYGDGRAGSRIAASLLDEPLDPFEP